MSLCDPDRQKYVDTLAAEIDDAPLGLHPQRIVGCRLGRRIGSYATTLYLFTKLLYVANVAAQFLLLNVFIGAPFTWWGWDVVKALLSGEKWQVGRIMWQTRWRMVAALSITSGRNL